ncbi:MAG: alpha/beta hydrolase, partial [Bauldia sp.]|nr:alpha/beta hydrolase [Bauldia sp.]
MLQAGEDTGTENRFNGTGGLRIFYRSWQPAESPRGVVVLVHGFNSHSGYYIWTANRLVASGLAVYALDLRGRGQSDGERFYVDSFADYVSDVSGVVAIARSAHPGLPLFLLGHSAGGV